MCQDERRESREREEEERGAREKKERECVCVWSETEREEGERELTFLLNCSVFSPSAWSSMSPVANPTIISSCEDSAL